MDYKKRILYFFSLLNVKGICFMAKKYCFVLELCLYLLFNKKMFFFFFVVPRYSYFIIQKKLGAKRTSNLFMGNVYTG